MTKRTAPHVWPIPPPTSGCSVAGQPLDSDLSSIFENHFGLLFSLAHRMLEDADDALDAVQSAVLGVHLASLRGAAITLGYTLAAVRNECILYRRMRSRRRDTLVSMNDDWTHSTTSDGSEEEFRHWVEQLLKLLPPRCGQVAVLRAEGMTYEEIANLLRISRKTVHAHVCAARKLGRAIRETYTDDLGRERLRNST